MPGKRYNTEEIIHKLGAADVLIAQGNAGPVNARRSIVDAHAPDYNGPLQ